MSPIANVSAVALPSAFVSAQAGLASSNRQLDVDAQQIANPDAGNVDAALIGSNQTLLTADAAAQVIKTADRMLGSLLDTRA